MIAEPYKIKEVKKTKALKPYERWNIIKTARFNTFNISLDQVQFDMVARGMSAWSHFQKAALMIGDEAYAGSRSYYKLETNIREILGLSQIVPAHNGIGAEKLLAVTLIKKGRTVLHNRGHEKGLVEANGGKSIDITGADSVLRERPDTFGGNIDLQKTEAKLRELGKENVAYLHLELCPDACNGQPLSMKNLELARKSASACGVPLVIDISNIMENAWWIRKVELPESGLMEIVRRITTAADIVLMDASQDPRSDVGGFISAKDPQIYDAVRNQVVVFEGLHTYGGMTGRAMETFAVGIEEMAKTELVEWQQEQVGSLYQLLKVETVPVIQGVGGISLDAAKFFPHLKDTDNPKFALAAALYIQGGIRGRIDGSWAYHYGGKGGSTLILDLPRCAYTRNHIQEAADVIASVYARRDEITGLKLTNRPEFVDQAEFEPVSERLFVNLPRAQRSAMRNYEPYKIAIFEPLKVTDRSYRKAAIQKAGYNTFLLNSEDVYIDFLTDSGTSAMSCHQWEGMTDTSDTPYGNKHYNNLVETFREVLGFNYIIPTHQGRAAEHIMSQCMIKPGRSVPGNMYFTTTKLHQEMAGGVFVDIIVDEAHDPKSLFPWKGNIDLKKLENEINRTGADKIAYISYECCVNMAGGQPFSMDNLRGLSRLAQKHNIPIMFDATRCVENAWMIKMKDAAYAHWTVREILREMMSYGDGCTISCKKDFLVNMGGILACNSAELNVKFQRMLRTWEGEITNGGLDTKDIEALTRGLLDSLDDDYIRMRITQTQEFGNKLIDAGIPIVVPVGSHAIFLDAKRFLAHVDQEAYPAQALAAALYIETGVRAMERGVVSKGRDPKTGLNYKPDLELVRCTIPRRVYTNSHIDFVVEGIKKLYEKREMISGLKFVYEPEVLRFFQGRFEPLRPWELEQFTAEPPQPEIIAAP
ncbi:MAG: tryptophanase [Elusimicrobia bacterium]|nr:tryptophanase [Elusimicrobiota bacterium]